MPKDRHRSTCTECSLRRQKCDRSMPCARCVRRGIPERCTLEWPGGKYNARVHRVYPRLQPPSKPAQSATSGESPTPTPNFAGQSGQLDTQVPHPGSGVHEARFDHQESLGASAKRLDYSFHPYEPTQLRTPQRVCSSRGSGFSAEGAGPQAFLQLLLPDIDYIWKLVDYHELYLLWYHGCYHGPTFRWELQNILSEQENSKALTVDGLDLQWLALLFSIMAGSLTCATEQRLEQWGFPEAEVAKLSMQWYKATFTCLNHAEWTLHHSIYAVHAIATLTMAAHPLGRSSELSVLLGAALKIAQSLGLDRLEDDPALETVTESSTELQRHQLLQQEIGRRLWSQLCIQDWMSLPFSGSHSINPGDFSTTKPSSRSHLTMSPIPATFPTYISYGNYLFDIAKLMVGHHQATIHSTTPYTKYEHVLEYDSRLRTLATKGMPRYFHVVEPIDPAWPEWVPWARRSLTICFAHKMIMIHRHFIQQSFTNPAFSMTRTTCVAASKTILNEAKQARDHDGPVIWIDKAFCVVAGIVLCLDIFHRSNSHADLEGHKQLVTDCIESLGRHNRSTIAVQGAELLKSLLTERDKSASSSTWPPQQKQLAQQLPPQAGFCNAFIYGELKMPY